MQKNVFVKFRASIKRFFRGKLSNTTVNFDRKVPALIPKLCNLKKTLLKAMRLLNNFRRKRELTFP